MLLCQLPLGCEEGRPQGLWDLVTQTNAKGRKWRLLYPLSLSVGLWQAEMLGFALDLKGLPGS